MTDGARNAIETKSNSNPINCNPWCVCALGSFTLELEKEKKKTRKEDLGKSLSLSLSPLSHTHIHTHTHTAQLTGYEFTSAMHFPRVSNTSGVLYSSVFAKLLHDNFKYPFCTTSVARDAYTQEVEWRHSESRMPFHCQILLGGKAGAGTSWRTRFHWSRALGLHTHTNTHTHAHAHTHTHTHTQTYESSLPKHTCLGMF